MPDRIVRASILTSDPINSVSFPAEVFFRRLLNVLDDFSRYDGRPSILRAALYPLKLDTVTEQDVSEWVHEATQAGLVIPYEVDGRPYLHVPKFGQKVRALKSKWPDPPTDVGKCRQTSANVPVVVDVDVSRNPLTSTVGLAPDVAPQASGKPDHRGAACALLQFLNQKTGKRYKSVKANTAPIIARMTEGYTEADLRQVIAMKVRQWSTDEKMVTFLRPKTLFNATNFANYAGELGAPRGEQ